MLLFLLLLLGRIIRFIDFLKDNKDIMIHINKNENYIEDNKAYKSIKNSFIMRNRFFELLGNVVIITTPYYYCCCIISLLLLLLIVL